MTDPSPASRARRILFLAALAVALVGRVGFGLSSEFWSEDERQTYLIGLSAFARGAWPYFGPDVVWTQSRIPGALEGLLIAGPLYALRMPEAPALLLNVCSFAALCAFAAYCSRRLAGLPRWLVWGWLLTAPWTIHFSTHIVNTSYVLPVSVVFFIGFFEAVPGLSAGLLRRNWAWAAMGFGLATMLQLHLSWVLLPPFVLVALAIAAREGPRALVRRVAALGAGSLPPALLLIPTIARAGFMATGSTEQNIVRFHPLGPGALISILARFLSFASFELNRFVGLDTAERLSFLADHWWLAPLAAFLLVVGLVQPVVLLITGLRAQRADPAWNAVRGTAAATVLLVYASYAFSIREPQAHAFYVTLPVATLFALHAWHRYASSRWFRRLAAVSLAVNVVFLALFAAAKLPQRSLYTDRALVQQAIDRRNSRLLGNRRLATGRAAILDPPDAALTPSRAPTDVLHVTNASWTRDVLGRVSRFDVTIANESADAAYIDLRYVTHYFDTSGLEVHAGAGVIKRIIQPGETRRWDGLVDGMADDRAVSATLAIVTAEPVTPVR